MNNQKVSKPEVPVVTSRDLANELNTDPKALRKTLRGLAQEGKIKHEERRWTWEPNSKDLKIIRKEYDTKAR